MDSTPSLESVLGKGAQGNSDGGTPPPAAPLESTGGTSGAPPAPAPAPAPAVDPFAKERAGLQAGMLAERRRAQAAEQALRELTQRQGGQDQGASRGSQVHDDEPPQRDDFQSDVDYLIAVNNWNTQQALDRYAQREDQRRRREQEHAQHQRAAQSFQERQVAVVQAGRQKYADFDQVINTNLGPILQAAPELRTAIIELGETSHDVAYYLAANPMEAVRLMGITDSRRLDRELGRIEARVEQTAPPADPAPQGRAPAGAPPAPAAPAAPLPRTLTQHRNTGGQFAKPGEQTYDGPKPLDVVLKRAKGALK